MNPSLSQFKALPKSHLTAPHDTQTVRHACTHFPRFGFDPKTNDYKVVVLKLLYLEKTCRCLYGDWAIELYSLNSNSWRNLGADAIPFPFGTCGTDQSFPYDNNCCHWLSVELISDHKSGLVVLSFDMVDDMFRKIKAPHITHSCSLKNTCRKELVPCNESSTIGVLDYNSLNRGTKWFSIDVWIMKDYWDDGSWVKQYSVGPTPFIYNTFVGYYGCNQYIWRDDNQKLVLYGLDCEEHKRDLIVCRNHKITGAVRYMESLVSLQRGVESYNVDKKKGYYNHDKDLLVNDVAVIGIL